MDKNRTYQIIQGGIVVDVKTYPKPSDFSIASVLEWLQVIIQVKRKDILENGNFKIIPEAMKETGFDIFDVDEVKSYDTLMMIQQLTNYKVRRGVRPKYDYEDDRDVGYSFREILLLNVLYKLLRNSISDFTFSCKTVIDVEERDELLSKVEEDIQEELLNFDYYEPCYNL